MSKIKEFTPRKERNSRSIAFEQKIKSHRRGRILKSLFFTVAIILSVWSLYYLWDNSSYSYYSEVSSYPRFSSSNSICVNHNGRVLTYSKDGINSMDAKGVVIWNETYEMQNPLVEVNKNAVAVGDYGGHVIYVLDEKGKVGEIDTNLPIRDFCISENGVVAAILEDQKATKLNLYDSKGKILVESESYMNQNGYPVAVALSENAEVMEVSYLQVDSSKVTSHVAFYNFSEVGQNKVDRLVSGRAYEETVIPYVGFFEDGGSFAVGSGRIIFYEGEEKPIDLAIKMLTEEIQAVYRGDNHVILVYVDTTGAALYRIDMYDKKGNLVLSETVDIQIHDILIQDKNIVIYNDTECIMYGISGKEKFRGSFGKSVSLLIPSNRVNRFLMITPTSVDVIELM
ncbi:MAG: hypothetical protein IKL51_01625 [Lachnospiraceae bacterium]|nr:hypothetical protein [Lachnospiraceae bacterium]